MEVGVLWGDVDTFKQAVWYGVRYTRAPGPRGHCIAVTHGPDRLVYVYFVQTFDAYRLQYTFDII